MNSKDSFLKVYTAAHNNAVDLLSEAEILFEKGKYARAYFLAFTGLEEIAKSQLAADVFTSFTEESEFWKVFRDHKKKIGRMAWASMDAEQYLDLEKETYLDIERPTPVRRMHGLYVHFDEGNVKSPKDLINEADARAIIHTLRVAIDRIIENDRVLGPSDRHKGIHEIAGPQKLGGRAVSRLTLGLLTQWLGSGGGSFFGLNEEELTIEESLCEVR
jgi:AbiV family abortive infection protein